MNPLLPVDGVLPPDLQGTLLRIGPGRGGAGAAGVGGVAGGGAGEEGGAAGALHAVELRDGTAVSYLTSDSEADANVFWHAGSVLALPESGLPQQYSRLLEHEEFGGGLTLPIASHVRREAGGGGRVLFGVEEGAETTELRIGEWDSAGALASFQSVTLERATWQHDIAVTDRHIVFIESPTEFGADLEECAVPYRWVPGAEGWVGVVERGGGGESAVRWFRLDPCLVTHVLGAYDESGAGGGGDGGDGGDGAIVLYVCCYPAPEKGQPFDLSGSVVGPAGIGECLIGGGLGVLERWRIEGDRLERVQIDERFVEYPRVDPSCEGGVPFRYGYCVETVVALDQGSQRRVDHRGLLRVDLARDEVAVWSPGSHCTASEPLFVRAVDGRADDEGWLLTVVDDPVRGGTDIYVLDASSFGRRGPQAVVHLPVGVRLPFRSHGEWIGADQYR